MGWPAAPARVEGINEIFAAMEVDELARSVVIL